MQKDLKLKQVDNYVFSLAHEFGRGAFGFVVKGVQKDTKEEVAVKIINLQHAVDQQSFIKNLNREIQILLNVKHENIVKLHKITQTTNNLYMFLELCNGGDLKQLLQKEGGRFRQTEAILYLRQICKGFQELHRLGIIHRDIKPANILIHNGIAKITDFGFARTLDCTQLNDVQKMTYLGTPLYMSPQILDRGTFSSKCDIWSLGMVFYQCLFGCTPWNGSNEVSLLQNIEETPLQFPENISCDENVKDLLRKMLIIEDTNRISWEELFQHPVITGLNNIDLVQEKFLNAAYINEKHFTSFRVMQMNSSVSCPEIQRMEDENSNDSVTRINIDMIFQRNTNALFGYLACLLFDAFQNRELPISQDQFLRVTFVFLKLFLIRQYSLQRQMENKVSLPEICQSDWDEYKLSKQYGETSQFMQIEIEIVQNYLQQVYSLLNSIIPNIASSPQIQQFKSCFDASFQMNEHFVKIFRDSMLEFIDALLNGLSFQPPNRRSLLHLLKLSLVAFNADAYFQKDHKDITSQQFNYFYNKCDTIQEDLLEADVKQELLQLYQISK